MTAEHTRALTRSEMALHDFDRFNERSTETYELSASDHKALSRALASYIAHLDRLSADLRRAGSRLPDALARERRDADHLQTLVLQSHRILIEPDE